MTARHAEVRREGGYWSVFVDGVRTVDRESKAVADNVAHYVNNPEAWDWTESCEVAAAIVRHLDEAKA